MRIALCGSAKFEKEFHEWNEKLTLSGHTVYGRAVYPSSKAGEKNWYDAATKTTLDLIHMDKILNSDAIVVIDVNEYIGESTTREVEWARIQRKAVYWITPHTNRFKGASRDAWAGILVRI